MEVKEKKTFRPTGPEIRQGSLVVAKKKYEVISQPILTRIRPFLLNIVPIFSLVGIMQMMASAAIIHVISYLAVGYFLFGAPTYTGFLDQYSAQGATWGFSSYKLNRAYAGNWGTVQRQSDNTTQAIGWDSSNKADVSAFNTFCSGTNCYATTINDQVSGINATQATLANMPRVIVDANGVLAVCPQPGSKMTTSFNSVVNTARQHLFVVAQGSYADNNHVQTGVPTITVTGDVANNNTTISNMSSQVGISTANDSVRGPLPGITDSSNFLPGPTAGSTTGNVYLSALPTGTTATIGKQPGNGAFPTGTQAGDTLTFTNSVLSGVWIMNGPASSTLSGAYWGAGLGVDLVPSDWGTARNTVAATVQNAFGQGMRGLYGVYDYDTFTGLINYNAVNLATAGNSGSITYSTNVGMTLFSNTNNTEQVSNSCFETKVLFPATQGSRVAMAQFLMMQVGISFPFAPNTSDGFAMTGVYQPNSAPGTTVYGTATIGPDVWGGSWNITAGGYAWPSLAYGNNITNSTTLYRFILHQGDSDTNITAAERSETAWAGTVATPGNDFSFFYQFQFEQIPTQTGSWCDTGQIHYGNGATTNAPDIVSVNCLNDQLQFVTQKNGPVTTNCGSAQTLTAGTTYAVVGTGHWTGTGSDTLTISFGTNGTSLSTVCNTSGTLWDNEAAGAYMKAGVYRGNTWENAGTIILRVMNPQFNPTTANAYSAYITSQPALPTH